jgi:hypothetical protein
MKIFAISDKNAEVIALLGQDPDKYLVELKPARDQYVHAIELPPGAESLPPHEIHRRLRILIPGQAPEFS